MPELLSQVFSSQMFGLYWIRPEYLWAIIPALLLFVSLWLNTGSGGSWSKVISADLLPFLIDGVETKKSRYPIAVLLAMWIIAAVAIAGPAFKKIPVPVYQKEDALIILLDLSPSMLAGDSAPSRVVQARREVLDLLTIRKEGLTGLIVYSGDAFIVSPLTSDTETIALLVPNLAPITMPTIGNDPVDAIKLASKLRTGAGINKAKLLWITDELPESDFDDIKQLLVDSNFDVSILGIGTKEGAPIPLANGGFLKDVKNAVVIPKLNETALQKMANITNGIYRRSVVSDADIIDLIEFTSSAELDDSSEVLLQEFDAWEDEGPWLALLLLPLLAIGFRKGWLLGLLILISPIEQSYADVWQDLWATKDQQAAALLNQGDAKTAAQLFEDPQWQAIAQHRAGEFDKAAEGFNEQTAASLYNKGTALARAGKIPEAIASYTEALKLNPKMEDAKFNKALLESLPPPPENDQQKNEQDKSSEQSDQNDDAQQQSADSEQEQDSQSNDADSEDDSEQEETDSQQDGSKKPNSQSEQNENSEPESTEKNQDQEQSKKPAEQQQNESEQTPDQAQEAANADSAEANISDEDNAAIEQQLRLLQDNPGELLRRKFQYQYEQNGGTGNSDGQRW